MTASVPKKPAQTEKTVRESEKKWGQPAIKAGFSVIPNILLEKQHALGLDCVDVVIILQIAKHWWRQGEAPYPSQVQIAKTMGVDLSTVKRHLARLRADGFIAWSGRINSNGGQASNAYDFSGLVEKIEPFAKEKNANHAQQRDKRKELKQRKRPRLHVVGNKGSDSE